MSSAARRRFSVRPPVVVADIGCGCRRPKLSSLLSYFQRANRRRPAARHPPSPSSTAGTSLWASTTMTNSSSFYSSHEDSASPAPAPAPARRRRGRKRWPEAAAAEGVAVVKDSSEPYADFRESMVQMIVENELYTVDDLNDLLHRFLVINSPRHHYVILRAFADLWPGE